MDGLSRDGESCSAPGSAPSASFVPLWCHFGLLLRLAQAACSSAGVPAEGFPASLLCPLQY